MAKRKKALTDVERAAREKLGFESLRPGQEDAVRSVLAGRDTLLVQPTGSGKSAIYQVAGLLIDGATIVVSPLIALQKDQVDSVAAQPHDATAAVLNSTLSAAETKDVLSALADGSLEFLFLAPEQLRKPEILKALQAAEPSLFVIDEAHCITEWGHDFRPDYLALGTVVEQLGHLPILAMTATASPRVREEIIKRLGMRDPAVLVHGFDRPNIHLRVDHFREEDEKLEALIRRVRWADKPGIVYAATRKNAERIMGHLREQDVSAVYYHGGMKAKEREAIQDRFMDGDAEVMVATNAFGMGIDKPDIRFVFHYDISDSLDSYYQEIGRAGRDGEPSEAVLFYRPQDVNLRKFQAGGGRMEMAELEKVAMIIERDTGPAEPDAIAEESDLSRRKVVSILTRLDDVGALQMAENGDVQLAAGLDTAKAAKAAAEAQDLLKQAQKERIADMQQYAEISTCRRKFLLEYFGEPFPGPCGHCDNDQPEVERGSPAGTRREVVG